MDNKPVEREAIKISTVLMNRIRRIAKRDGYLLARLVEQLIELGLEQKEKA